MAQVAGRNPTPPREEPAYRAVAQSLRDQIRTGAYPPTRRLPTDAELGETFGVSRQTVRQAFNQLVAEGLVYRVRGRGSTARAFMTSRSRAFRRQRVACKRTSGRPPTFRPSHHL